MPASARVPNMATLLGIVLVWSIASTAGGRPRILDQSRRLPKFGGRVVLRGQRLRISRSDRSPREGLGHRRQGIRPVRRGHAKS
jgi:hypothetical protein